MYGCMVIASRRDFANPYPNGKAMARDSRKPNTLSSIVTRALLKNTPDFRPANRLENTSAGAGRNRADTWPGVVTIYHANKTSKATIIDGVAVSRCSAALGVEARSLLRTLPIVPAYSAASDETGDCVSVRT